MNSSEKNKIEKSTLYLVATPIGNLSDMSERGIKVLSEVDFIAAEDTRNSLRLLLALGIKKELISYHEHNKKAAGERIISRLATGESCALITDAGMPAISDPGEDIVKLASDSGFTVTVIPGACAAVSALAISALSTSKFCFEGFLSANKSERRRALSALSEEARTMIFYEAPHKLRSTLADMKEVFGDERKISLCREITKINEEVIRTTLSSAVSIFEQKEPRGEFVLIVEGYSKSSETSFDSETNTEHAKELVDTYVNDGISKMDAIKKAAKACGMTKSELYKILNT